MAGETSQAMSSLDDLGALVTSQQYDPWGQPTGTYQPTPFGFTGELQDSGSGLVYLRARWYQPSQGTLLGRDPFEGTAQQPASLHQYQYGWNAPTMHADPSGRDPYWRDHLDINFHCEEYGYGPTSYPHVECLNKQRDARLERMRLNGVRLPGSNFRPLTRSEYCDLGSFAPVAGELIDAWELGAGTNCGTGQPLSLSERAVSGLCLIFPFVGGRIIRGLSKGTRSAARGILRNLPDGWWDRYGINLYDPNSPVLPPAMFPAQARTQVYDADCSVTCVEMAGPTLGGPRVIPGMLDDAILKGGLSMTQIQGHLANAGYTTELIDMNLSNGLPFVKNKLEDGHGIIVEVTNSAGDHAVLLRSVENAGQSWKITAYDPATGKVPSMNKHQFADVTGGHVYAVVFK